MQRDGQEAAGPSDGGPTRLRRVPSGLALAALFGVALALRLVFLAEVRSIPFIEAPLIDARAYDAWAREIAGGAWWGDRVFYQAPVYPYFLAVVYVLLGPDLWTVNVVQMFVGALSCVMMFLATRAFFGERVAWVAGLCLAFYPPAIFFDGIIQKTSLGLLLSTTLLWLLGRFQRSPRTGPALAAGCVLGLLSLTRENALAFVPAVPLWMWVRFAGVQLGLRVRWVAAFAAGVAVVLLPVGARNYAVGDTFVLTTSQMGTNLWIGNNPEATGLYAPLLPGRQTPTFEAPDAKRLAERELGRELTSGEVSDYWRGRALDFVVSEPGRWLELMLFKLALTWNQFEIADTEDLHLYAEWSALLAGLLALLHFGIVVPLAGAGIVFAGREGRDAWLLVFLALVYALGVALFMVFARMRFPLVPLMLPLAALAVVRAFERARARSWSELARPVAVLVVVGYLANVDLVPEEGFKATAYINLAGIMLSDDRAEAAEPYLERAFEITPDSPDLRLHLAVLRLRQQRLADAEGHLRRMIELEPSDYRGHRLLAQTLLRQGRGREAAPHRRRARELNPALEKPPDPRRVDPPVPRR